MKILLLSGYHAVSHRYWCQGLMNAFAEHQWQHLALPARHFNWRIRGAPLSWLAHQRALLEDHYDLLIATSMVDLATLKGLFANLARVPSICYFHENQFEYPQTARQQSNVDAQMVNLYAALAADRVVFNSAFNRDTLVAGANRLLAKLPDHRPSSVAPLLEGKTEVLPVPIDDGLFGDSADQGLAEQLWGSPKGQGPVKLVWAARREYDKGPDRLLALLRLLDQRQLAFQLCLLGESFRQQPPAFNQIEEQFGDRLVHSGYEPDRQRYQAWLAGAELVLSTSIHEFQGVAVLEAIALGCIPLLPERMAYPELVDRAYLYPSLLGDVEAEAAAAADRLQQLLTQRQTPEWRTPSVERLRWGALKPAYQQLFERVTGSRL